MTFGRLTATVFSKILCPMEAQVLDLTHLRRKQQQLVHNGVNGIYGYDNDN